MRDYEFEEYEALSDDDRARLLAAVRALGAECAREAYQMGLNVAYQVTGRGDVDALRELLQQYGVHEVPYGYTPAGAAIWAAFWEGAESVDRAEVVLEQERAQARRRGQTPYDVEMERFRSFVIYDCPMEGRVHALGDVSIVLLDENDWTNFPLVCQDQPVAALVRGRGIDLLYDEEELDRIRSAYYED
jgi:hypothetical protein